jgi:8-oxo-dGTP diphosphatase
VNRKYCYQYPRPAVTVDIILLRRGKRRRLEVLLIKRGRPPFKGRWAFPGGFISESEPLEAAARRELKEETGITGGDLEQLGAFGDPGRDPRGHTVSVVFGCLINGEVEPKADDDAADVDWHPARRPPPLAFDHALILRAALNHFDGRL